MNKEKLTNTAYNGLRLTNQLDKTHEDVEVQIFLMADAAACAIAGHSAPNGCYNIEPVL